MLMSGVHFSVHMVMIISFAGPSCVCRLYKAVNGCSSNSVHCFMRQHKHAGALRKRYLTTSCDEDRTGPTLLLHIDCFLASAVQFGRRWEARTRCRNITV